MEREENKRLPKPLKDEKGITLIETLTALLLFGMVATILYSFLIMGTSMYKRVSVESQIRNQGDAMFGSLITELRDAVYVKQVSSMEIVYAKKAATPEQYVDTYRMAIETLTAGGPYGVSVYSGNGTTPIKRFELTSPFMISTGVGETFFASSDPRAVNVKLTYKRTDSATLTKADNPTFTIESRVLLSRLE